MTATNNPKYRYLGVQPFDTEAQDRFFGRDSDIKDLYNLISLEKLVVLFGKSGYGKSSLLNAGIVPKLQNPRRISEKFNIIPIHLGAFSEEIRHENGELLQARRLSPTQYLLDKLNTLYSLKNAQNSALLDTIAPEKTLWREFKRHQQGANKLRFVLLFDQFEEFFTYPLAEQVAFKEQLAVLLYEEVPQKIRDAAENLESEQLIWLHESMMIKIVFAIRSDKMSFLDSLKDYLPAILHKRYELKALTSEQAKLAITEPAALEDEKFSSPRFEYPPQTLTKMIAALTKANSDIKSQGVEAFQLQLLCESIESKVLKGGISDIDGNGLLDILPEHLPEMERLYEEYYLRKLEELPEKSRIAAQLVLEEGLLAEDAATGEGRRMSVDSNALLGNFRAKGLTNNLLQSLEKTFLIRPETNTVGGVSYEISHDTLLAPIQKMKAERRAREEKERLEATAEAERKEIEKTKKQLRTVQALLGVAVLAVLFAGWQWHEADKLLEVAKKATIEAQAQKENAIVARNEAQESDCFAKVEKENAIIAKESADSARVIAGLKAHEAEKSAKEANEALLESLEAKQKEEKRKLGIYESANSSNDENLTKLIKASRNNEQKLSDEINRIKQVLKKK